MPESPPEPSQPPFAAGRQPSDERDLRFAAIWETASDAMALSDASGIVLDANPAYCLLYGRTRDEIVGRSFAIIFPPERREWAEEQYRATFRQADLPPTIETTVRRADGTELWVEARYTFLTDADGNRAVMLSVIRDITERKHAEEMRARLAAIVESSDDAIVSKDLDGVIMTWNAGAERLFGYSAAEAVGRPITIVIPPERLDEEPEILGRIRRGERIDHFETVRQHKDGTLLDISLTVSPIIDGSGTVVGASKIARDITERRMLERQKDAFIGIAAHELRTPVTGIKAYTQLLARRLRHTGDDAVVEIIDKLDAQADRLTGLIGDLLDATRIQSGTLPFRLAPFDLTELLAEVIDEAQRTTAQHRIVADSVAPITLVGDRERIGQVVMNLLTNAIKYSPQADRVEVGATCDGENVIVSVRDFGIGIPVDEQQRIFDRFYRATSADRAGYPGLGLGLYITAEFVTRHGGRIWVESEEGQGTIVSFSVPLAGSPSGPAGVIQAF